MGPIRNLSWFAAVKLLSKLSTSVHLIRFSFFFFLVLVVIIFFFYPPLSFLSISQSILGSITSGNPALPPRSPISSASKSQNSCSDERQSLDSCSLNIRFPLFFNLPLSLVFRQMTYTSVFLLLLLSSCDWLRNQLERRIN